MRRLLWRHRFKLTVVTFPLALATLAVLLLGNKDVAFILLAAFTVVSAARQVIDRWCRPAPPRLEPGELAAIRTERDSMGEVPAVRMLRSAHPDLGLTQATLLVRNL